MWYYYAAGAAVVLILIIIIAVAVSKSKKKTKVEPIVEEVKVEPVKDVEVSATEEVAIGDVKDGADVSKRVSFAEKLLSFDSKVCEYYNAIYNKFISLRNINPRVSSKGVSFRLGRDLVARISIRGKTMRLHLALNVKDFDEKVYFHKDFGDVKSYEEIPLLVKVRSDRGLKNAMKLIDALIESKGIEAKTRYNAVDAVSDLKSKLA